jgi:hypothetical protein
VNGVIVNVCPAAVSSAPAERIWRVMTSLERIGEWQDARFVSASPPGPMESGQVLSLAARGFGREWPVKIEVRDIDPRHRWLDLLVNLPFGVENHENVTLTETKEGGTLVRFN